MASSTSAALLAVLALLLCSFVLSVPSFDVSKSVIYDSSTSNGVDCENPLYTAECAPKLRVRSALSSRGSNWVVSFRTPSTAVFLGPSNGVWGSNSTSDVDIGFQLVQSSINIRMTDLGYWGSQSVQMFAGCVSGAYCCVDNNNVGKSFKLVASNLYPKYRIFQMVSASTTWDISLNLTIDNQTTQLRLSNAQAQGGWPPNAARPVLSSTARLLSVDPAIPIQRRYFLSYLAVDTTWSRSPFMVPQPQLSDGAARIALTQATFNSLMSGSCDLETATQLSQVSSTSGDSFGDWFVNSIVSLVPDSWVSIPNSRFSPASGPYYMQLMSNSQQTFLIDAVIDSDDFTLRPLSAEPIGVGGGMYLPSAQQFLVYLDVSNAGRTTGVVEVTSQKCCYMPISGSNQLLSCANLFVDEFSFKPEVKSLTMTPGETQRLRFTSSIVPTGQSGYCTFALRSGLAFVSYYDVGFEIPVAVAPTSPNTPTAPTAPTAPTTVCDPPFIPSPDPPYCLSPCTIDQTYNNATGNCDPVDCVAKYQGARNLYDTSTGVCKPGITPSPSSPIPPDSPPSSPSTVNPPSVPSEPPQFVYNISCGPHGKFNPKTITCDCDPGWITDMNQPSYSFVYCDLASNFAPNTIVGAQSPNNKVKVSYFALMIALPITIVVVIIAAIAIVALVKKFGHKNHNLSEPPYE